VCRDLRNSFARQSRDAATEYPRRKPWVANAK
jgi:hypothetical protein